MQVSSAPPMGGSGQHHQLDPGVILPSETTKDTVSSVKNFIDPHPFPHHPGDL